MEPTPLGWFLFLLIFPFSFSLVVSSLNSDGLSLLALKSAISSDPTHSLDTWFDSNSTPCKWLGITCNIHGRVTQIHLPNKHFTGYIPSELGTLIFLKHLDLSSNLFNGSLPLFLPHLPNLAGTLNLSYNRFSSNVPPSYGSFRLTVSLDLRHNNLTGKIPQIGSLLNQGPTAFSGNPYLCGFPLRTLCPEDIQNPKIPQIQTENPTNPKDPNLNLTSSNPPKTARGGSLLVTIPIISGVSFIVGAVFVLLWLIWRKCCLVVFKGKVGKDKKLDKEAEEEQEEQNGKFVVMTQGFGLELEDLLRASAYVVGKSPTGIVYKVVVGSGTGGMVVAVRRLSEGGAIWRLKEFESEMEAIGRVQHDNIVRLRAYYYASDEKLLVSDFIPNGSLYSALHGGTSNSLSPLSWAARLKIAQGIARGIMNIHECNPRKFVHGSITSSKILLDDTIQPLISGFGLTRLISSGNKYSTSLKQSSNSNALSTGIKSKSLTSLSGSYVAPEVRISGSKLTQKCDIYSFGIVLLELLTGRLPGGGPEKDEKELECFVRRAFRDERPLSEIIDPELVHEVYAKKQVLSVFHVALNCTELVPEMRPKMKAVLESLERVESHSN